MNEAPALGENEELDLYTDPYLANICQLFYDQYYDTERIMSVLDPILEKISCRKVLFIGPLANIAAELSKRGANLTLVDNSAEMLAESQSRLTDLPIIFEQADVRLLPQFSEKFDLIIMPGRVTAYLLTDDDINNAIRSLNQTCKPGGTIIFDFFDAEKMKDSIAFNRVINSAGIVRKSHSQIVENDPPLTVNWTAGYSIDGGKTFTAQSPHKIRGFTRGQMAKYLSNNGIHNAEFSDSFEEDSQIVVINL